MGMSLKGTSMARLSLLLALPALVIGTCEVDLDSVSGSYPPLLIQGGDFKLPNTSPVLTFKDDEELELFCHDSPIILRWHENDKYLDSVREDSIKLSCSQGEFHVKGIKEKFNVEKASCNRKQEPRLSFVKDKCSPVGADGLESKKGTLERVSLGWQVGDSYIEQIQACFDTKFDGTLWAKHTVHGASIKYKNKKSKPRPGFKADTEDINRFFLETSSSGLYKLYKMDEEEKTVKKELGGVNTINEKPIIETFSSATHYFAKGHLAPHADFIYKVQQEATYYYVNAAPQFQSFNNGNWKALEEAVRDLACSLRRDLQVVTGTHKILQYRNSNKKLTKIFLWDSKKNGKKIPAPMYYWKLVKDPKTNTAAVFIGLNNPHIKDAPQKLCRDRCAEMSSWVKVEGMSRLDAGYMYCCSVKDASKQIKAIPVDKETEDEDLLVGEEPKEDCKKK